MESLVMHELFFLTLHMNENEKNIFSVKKCFFLLSNRCGFLHVSTVHQ